MLNRMLAAMCVVAIAFAFSTTALAQEATKMEEKKGDSHGLKLVMCDPDCGFMVRSHDEKELVTMVKEHSKNIHKKEMSDKDAMALIKPAEMRKREKMKKDDEKK